MADDKDKHRPLINLPDVDWEGCGCLLLFAILLIGGFAVEIAKLFVGK